MPYVAMCELGTKVKVPSSKWYPDDVGVLLEKSSKSCKILWQDGGIGLYDYDSNSFFVMPK